MEQEMKYILQVYQDGSFSKAADALYLTQPALSLAVKRVEERLGAELFDRNRRPLELTQAGRAYMDTIRRIQHLEDELHCEIEDLRGLKTGRLRIGGSHYINSYILAPILAEFSRKYPGIQIELLERGSDTLARALERREIDLTFSCDPATVAAYESRPAFHDYILLAVPQSFPLPCDVQSKHLSASEVLSKVHLKSDVPSVQLSCFRDIEFILLKQGINLYDRSLKMFADSGFSPKIKMTISQMVTAYRLADNQMGATFISDRIVRSHASRLNFFKINSDLTDRMFFALQPKRNYIPFAVREFVDFALEIIRQKEQAAKK